MTTPEDKAREEIDRLLSLAGWDIQDAKQVNLTAANGVAIRNFPLEHGHGFADYLLYVDGKAAGVVEAKKEGHTLTGVEIQSEKYSKGLPPHLPAHIRPLPFLYQSTGTETRFTNELDPVPRSRTTFAFHKPQTFAEWLEQAKAPPVDSQSVPLAAEPLATYKTYSTLRKRLQQLPTLIEEGLWPAQKTAIRNLEQSLSQDRPRALIQMATGSGKTFTAITAI
ncbi:MAG: type I restriction endonuclease, partial [Nitrospirales bacterium]|nr:type I restriction endonuclease [Nitrospirales bacterium]